VTNFKPATRNTTAVETALLAARARIEVTQEELAEAELRRRDLSDALKAEFSGSRTFVNGSVAHRDALNPLSDIDLGVVIPDPDGVYGPGKNGPSPLQERAANAIQGLRPKYPNLRVEYKNRKRSILVRFGEPVAKGEADFTADIIVAIDNPTGAGLYIPSFDRWDRSHPEKHTQLVQEADSVTAKAFSRGTRLMKHWNRRHDKPLCSWNIKALALGALSEPASMTTYIELWLDHAIKELNEGETEDPARVAGPIKMNKTKTEVLRLLREARDIFSRALQLEKEGYSILALNELAKFFKDEDVMPRPSQDDVRALEVQRFKAMNFDAPTSLATSASTTAMADRIDTRSWSF
jgi:hypothetical protein